MEYLNAAEVFALMTSEQECQVLDEWRRWVRPTLAEALRDFEEQQVRALARYAPASHQSVEASNSVLGVGGRSPAPIRVDIVQPKGGVWPHQAGASWTNAEREALFLMRHRHGKTGEELAGIAGVSRQMIDDLIGPKRPHGGLAAIKAKSNGWTPSAELLALCKAPLQPLQSTAVQLIAA
jgi:hypothetical protein